MSPLQANGPKKRKVTAAASVSTLSPSDILLDLSSSCLLVQAFSWSSIHSVSFSKLDKQLLFCCHDNKNSPTVTLSGCWAVLCPELFHTEKYLLHHLSDIFLTHWIKIFLILIFKMHKKEIALDEALYLCGWAL